MSPAPLRSALVLFLALGLALAAAPAQRPLRPDRQNPLTRAIAPRDARAPRPRGGRVRDFGYSGFGRVASTAVGPTLQLLGPGYLLFVNVVDALAGRAGVDAALTLFTTSIGASAGGADIPATRDSVDSSEELKDLP